MASAISIAPALGATSGGGSTQRPHTPGLTTHILPRIKNILLSPNSEWPVIAAEPTSPTELYVGYVMPLAALAAVMAFVHMSLIGVSIPFGGVVRSPILSGLLTAVLSFVGGLIGVFLVGLIINALAPTFGGSRDQRQALKASAYSLTPGYLSSVLALSPVLPTLLQLTAGLYGIYVLYLGLPVVMGSPRQRAGGYTAAVVVCSILVGIVFGIVSAGIGFLGHSSGLMGNDAATHAATREQSAAMVGNMIGGALGTDAQGKAGLTAAISNLAKAGEQSAATENAAPATPVSTPAGTPAAAAGEGANPLSAVGGLMNALGGALGGEHRVAAVDFKTLTALLPASLPGMKRIDARGEAQGAMGVKTSSATGTYQGDKGANVRVEITDMSGVAGLMGLADTLVQNSTSESDSGFEREQTLDGRAVHEKYDYKARHGEVSVMLAKRYQVEVTGDDVDIKALEQSLGQMDLARLEAMKDLGTPSK